MEDKISYVRNRKQEKVRQKEAILRYLDSLPTINNTEARALLKLQEKDRSAVSRLFAELVTENMTTDRSIRNARFRQNGRMMFLSVHNRKNRTNSLI